MAHTSPCDQCSQTGLPILFTRYAAAYSATEEGRAALDALKPAGSLKAWPGGIALKTAKYNVRMLRTGYLYLRLESSIRKPEWLGYVVHPHGYFTSFQIHSPYSANNLAACRPNEWGANRSLVWIQDAENVTKLHFMFHPDPIDPEHLKSVIGSAPDKYMQSIKVSDWVKGSTNQDDTMLPDTLGKMVLEFKALSSDATLQAVGNEQFFGFMGCNVVERNWGEWDELVTPPPEVTATGEVYFNSDAELVHHSLGSYDSVHGPRLRKIVEYLKANKGAVVACEDPIGIAQELSMHHLTAAIPYVRWLLEVDAKGVSNQFKQAASESVSTLRLALQKGTMTRYDEGTENLRRSVENRMEPYPGSDMPGTVKVRQADGSYKDMTIPELNKQRNADDLRKADERERDRAQAEKDAGQEAAEKTRALCDNAALEAFDKLHKVQLKKRDDLMDLIASDLLLWLAIGQIKGDAWVSWLLAQPFRATMVKDADADPLANKKQLAQASGANEYDQ